MNIIIFGGTGSLGKRLVKYYLNKRFNVFVYSRNEFLQWKLKQQFSKVKCIIGDIQQPIKINHRIDYIINCAALKHVSTGIDNPLEVVKTNILGTQNVIDYALSNNIKKVVHISTDKCIEPINTYGATKMVADKLCFVANKKKNIFSVVRFGNLFGSSGSVIKIFLDLYNSGVRTFPVSHVSSERYFLTYKQAVKLIEKARLSDKELIIGQYKKMRIGTLVKAIDEGNKIKLVGLRPEEKIMEKISDDYKDIYYTEQEIRKMIWEYLNEKEK